MKILVLFSFIFLQVAPSFGARVHKIKKQMVLIKTDGDNLSKGKLYYSVINGKKTGIIRVLKFRPGQALGKILKGRTAPNAVLKKRPSKKNVTKKSSRNSKITKSAPPTLYKRPTRKKIKKQSKMALGFALGYNSNSSNVVFFKNENGENVTDREDSYTGTSTSYEALIDYRFSKKLTFRTSLGIHNFNAGDEGNTQCFDDQNQPGLKCLIDLSYFNLDLWAKYQLTRGVSNIWVGAGVGILLSPKLNSTTALNPDDVATTTLMQIGLGSDFSPSSFNKVYFPIWAEYGLYPSSDTVDMTSISFYLGIAYKL